MVSRGEIWLVTLDPTIGSEMQKTRPCIVVSPDDMNASKRTLLIAPLTSKLKPAPYRVALHFRQTDGMVLPEQLRVVDRRRLIKRLGHIDVATLNEVLRVLGEMFSA